MPAWTESIHHPLRHQFANQSAVTSEIVLSAADENKNENLMRQFGVYHLAR